MYAHPIFGAVSHSVCSTDNNCVSIVLDFGKNKQQSHSRTHGSRSSANPINVMLDRSLVMLTERETSQKQFTALKCRDSFYSILVFASGALIVVGLQDSSLTRLCVIKSISSIVDTLEYPVRVKRVTIVNTVSTFNRFSLNFTSSLRDFFVRHCIAFNYNPETFPGMFFKVRVPSLPLEKGETIGEYYTRAALSREEKDRRNVSSLFRFKTVLVFKVGKCTVLGECGGDDMSVISKLLFGFFFYFMDHHIKLSVSEAMRMIDKYGIPPLEWYLFSDFFFYTHPYVKPSSEIVRRAVFGLDSYDGIDQGYYGPAGGECDRRSTVVSMLSANLISSVSEVIAYLRDLRSQRPLQTIRSMSRIATREAYLMLYCSPRPRYTTDTKGVKKIRYYLPPQWGSSQNKSSDSVSVNSPVDYGFNPIDTVTPTMIFDRKPKTGLIHTPEILNRLMKELVSAANARGCISGMRIYDPEKVVAAEGTEGDTRVLLGHRRLKRRRISTAVEEPEPETFLLTRLLSRKRPPHSLNKDPNTSGSRYISGSRSASGQRLQKTHSVETSRLDTLALVHRTVTRLIASGRAAVVSNALGSDIYSILHDSKLVGPSRGLEAALRRAAGLSGPSRHRISQGGSAVGLGDGYYRTVSPGSQFFDRILNSTAVSGRGSRLMTSSIPARGNVKLFDSHDTDRWTVNLAATLKKIQAEEAHTRQMAEGVVTSGTPSLASLSGTVSTTETNRAYHAGSSEDRKYTPMDFISSVQPVVDSNGQIKAAGVEMDLAGMLRQLECGQFFNPEVTPMANYRTSLQRSSQARTTLEEMVVDALTASGTLGAETEDCFPDNRVVDTVVGSAFKRRGEGQKDRVCIRSSSDAADSDEKVDIEKITFDTEPGKNSPCCRCVQATVAEETWRPEN
uniref:Wsv303-like protein n=1 Tax=Melicertus latisulcatus pemonivirus TaxID=2984278 RepID=A0A9C7CF11_9VIRU|nr:MAG: wsv303-like protein [Melicertus latisulcatus pemonivirus]